MTVTSESLQSSALSNQMNLFSWTRPLEARLIVKSPAKSRPYSDNLFQILQQQDYPQSPHLPGMHLTPTFSQVFWPCVWEKVAEIPYQLTISV